MQHIGLCNVIVIVARVAQKVLINVLRVVVHENHSFSLSMTMSTVAMLHVGYLQQKTFCT